MTTAATMAPFVTPTRPRLPAAYVPHDPHAKQRAFLVLPQYEVFFGGSAGPGKSEALLMAALQYVDVPGYAALLLRRSYRDLALPGGLMDRAAEWLANTPARWVADTKTWKFPTGGKESSLTFGYLARQMDHLHYQGAELQFVGFDELTQFQEYQYLYLHSRMRRVIDADPRLAELPVRIRSASNPGGPGHEWVEQRFIPEDFVAADSTTAPTPQRDPETGDPILFLPATIADNPSLNREEYEQTLKHLDPITRAQLLRGDWSARQSGGKFKRSWFEIVDHAPPGTMKIRAWDTAATEVAEGKDPDWTAGTLLGELDGQFYVLDAQRIRAEPGGVDEFVAQVAHEDGVTTNIVMEQERGGSGKLAIGHFARHPFKGYSFYGVVPTGDKEVRANPVASAAYARNIKIVRGDWNRAFLAELDAFPFGSHDDWVDSLSLAFAVLTGAVEVGDGVMASTTGRKRATSAA